MDERMQFVARRLAWEPMAELCREFGISRKTGYKIFDRYQECGIHGLTDRSRRPYRYANQLPFQVENYILNVKREHASWGARKIRERLTRRFSGIPIPATSTIHAVLDRHGLVERRGRMRRRAHDGAFDFILSTLNVPFDLDSYVRMLKPEGQLCMVASPLKALSLSGGLLNNSRRSVSGNYIGSRKDTADMLAFSAEHGIEAIVDVMPFARVNEAIERVRRRDVRVGLVLENRELDTAHLRRPRHTSVR